MIETRGLDQMQTLQASKLAIKKTNADLDVKKKFFLQRQNEVDEMGGRFSYGSNK